MVDMQDKWKKRRMRRFISGVSDRDGQEEGENWADDECAKPAGGRGKRGGGEGESKEGTVSASQPPKA
jgi:hypothetical protein